MPDNNVTSILEELKKTIDAIGTSETIKKLQEARSVTDNVCVQFVVATVCRHFSLEVDQVLKERMTSDTVKYAKSFIIFYLRNDFEIVWADIKIIFDQKDQSWLYELMNLVKNLKPHLTADKPLIAAKELLDKQVKDFKKNK